MAINPEKNTISTNHVQALQASIKALEKIDHEATAKNKDDPSAKDLHNRLTRLKEEVAALKPAATQMQVYEGTKEKIKRALTELPKLAKLVKKPGEDDKPVAVTVTYSNVGMALGPYELFRARGSDGRPDRPDRNTARGAAQPFCKRVWGCR